MKIITRQYLIEFLVFVLLSLGIVFIAKSQDTSSISNKSSVQIEVEVYENGKSTKTNKYFEINSDELSEEIDNMVSDIEKVLEQAIGDIENAAIEVNIQKHLKEIQFPDFNAVISTFPKFEWHSEADSTIAFLGIEGQDKKDKWGNSGVAITKIIPESVAEKAGLQNGDLITNLDGLSIASFEQLATHIKSKSPKDDMNIKYIRNGEEREQKVSLGSKTLGHNTLIMKIEDENGFKTYSFPDYFKNNFHEKHHDSPKLGIEAGQNNAGIQVMRVLPNSLGEDLGLEIGDIITAIDGNKISDLEMLKTALSNKEQGEKIKVTVARKGKNQTLSSIIPNNTTPTKQLYQAHIQKVNSDEIELIEKLSGKSLDVNNALQVNSLNLSPNPSNGIYDIEIDPVFEGEVEISVFNAYGGIVFKESFQAMSSGSTRCTVNISDAPAGMYYLSILQNGKGLTQRLIKQ